MKVYANAMVVALAAEMQWVVFFCISLVCTFQYENKPCQTLSRARTDLERC